MIGSILRNPVHNSRETSAEPIGDTVEVQENVVIVPWSRIGRQMGRTTPPTLCAMCAAGRRCCQMPIKVPAPISVSIRLSWLLPPGPQWPVGAVTSGATRPLAVSELAHGAVLTRLVDTPSTPLPCVTSKANGSSATARQRRKDRQPPLRFKQPPDKTAW